MGSSSSSDGWNPHFVVYAHSQGRQAEDQLALDKERFPGGCMTGFLVWMNERIVEFSTRYPEASSFFGGGSLLAEGMSFEEANSKLGDFLKIRAMELLMVKE